MTRSFVNSVDDGVVEIPFSPFVVVNSKDEMIKVVSQLMDSCAVDGNILRCGVDFSVVDSKVFIKWYKVKINNVEK